ncbi:hypothetical protein I5M27_08385 [Adhaeribacter sp. BT258]|uniref:Uncharacterized protein n=1 Tax=Adhaeribacter terrigena TaxID=2793070 RepID=A0ABS1C0S4_9BACT|nr:hypothetical protein [Adhaeribacter terrigena]MBK0403003.1 hypothetical protein [Adhaeribacter terrigena]
MDLHNISEKTGLDISIIKLIYQDCLIAAIKRQNPNAIDYKLNLEEGTYITKYTKGTGNLLKIKHLEIREGLGFRISFINTVNTYLKTGNILVSSIEELEIFNKSIFNLNDINFIKHKKLIDDLKEFFAQNTMHNELNKLLRDVDTIFSDKPASTHEETVESISAIDELLNLVILHNSLIKLDKELEDEDFSDLEEDYNDDYLVEEEEEEEDYDEVTYDKEYDYDESPYCSSCQMSPCMCSDRERTSTVFDF